MSKLQEPPLKAWKGEQSNVSAPQRLFSHRARCSIPAFFGKYSVQMEAIAAQFHERH